MTSKLTKVTLEYEPECTCTPIDLTQFGETIPCEHWRELSLQGRLCGILGCSCPTTKQCGCKASYCAHHGAHHFHLGANPVVFTSLNKEGDKDNERDEHAQPE